MLSHSSKSDRPGQEGDFALAAVGGPRFNERSSDDLEALSLAGRRGLLQRSSGKATSLPTNPTGVTIAEAYLKTIATF